MNVLVGTGDCLLNSSYPMLYWLAVHSNSAISHHLKFLEG